MKRTHPGHPPLVDDDETARASIRLPARELDRAYSQARRDRESLSDLIRRGIRRELAGPARAE